MVCGWKSRLAAGETTHVSRAEGPVSMARSRCKACRREKKARGVVVGSKNSGAKPPAGGCGVKDQVSKAVPFLGLGLAASSLFIICIDKNIYKTQV